eukprot:EG_transcript_16801
MAMVTHTPYAIPAPQAVEGAEPQKRPRPAPVINRAPFSRTLAVLQEVQVVGKGYHEVPRLGWRVLQHLWHLTPEHFDTIALAHLGTQPGFVQQHVLLVLATTSVQAVKNLSAFLRSLIREVGEKAPVCLGFIAGCCRGTGCPFVHPTLAPGWQLLQERWQLGWLDFDYLVLNSLLLKPQAKQDQILRRLAGMKVQNIRNPSALLASIIRQCEGDADHHRPSPTSSVQQIPNPPPGVQPPSQRAPSLAGSDDAASSDAGTFGPSDSFDTVLDEGVLHSFVGHPNCADRPPAGTRLRRPPLTLPIPFVAPEPPASAHPLPAAPPPSRGLGPVPAPSPGIADSPDQPAPWRGTGHVVEALRPWAALPPPAA